MTQEYAITWMALVLGLGLVGLMSWRERRPRQGFETPLIPTTPVMFIGGLIALLALVHLVNLAGFHTGR
jgi:hypothetical protein